MKRILFGSVAFVAIGVGLMPVASGHGGQFQNPGGGVPPGLRPPTDPTPPPPPPPPTGTPTDGAPPTTPPGGSTPPATPTTPGSPPTPPTTGLPEGPGRPKSPTLSGDHWTYWWAFNDAEILGLKDEIYRLRVSPSSPLGQLGGASGNRTAATRMTEKRVREEVVPSLLAVMDPATREHPDTRSAAFLALAKVTRDPAHLDVLLRGVYDASGRPNAAEDPIVRESAALALGLLRRGEAERQFDAKDLDRARDAAFAIFEDGRLQARTRAFAMFSVGLLGDQPTARGVGVRTGDGIPAADASPSAADRIESLLRLRYAQDDLPIALLLALSLQSPASVRPEVLDALRECMLKGRFEKERVSDLVASYAALALGRLGTPEHARALLLAVKTRAMPVDVQRSAAIALGRVGARADGPARAEIAAGLVQAAETARDGMAKDFAVMSLAEILVADVRANRTDVLDAKGPSAADLLVRIATSGSYAERPFGALAAGLVSRAIGETPSIVAYGELRGRLDEALLAGLSEKGLDGRSRGAFAIGLGLAREGAARTRLLAVLSDAREDSELRGYAAVGLGLLGDPSPEMIKAVERTMAGKTTEELRVQCATALGLLGATDAVDLLLKEFESASSQNVTGQVVLALGKIGDARALPPLVALLKDASRPDLTRAMACAGLGLVGDLERVPSLSRISTGLNYRAGCDAVAEVLSIL